LARRKRGRPINGILVLDKPAGQTSNALLQTVKRLYFAQKAGHTGTLDPLATGVLPLCFGEATKFSQYLLDSDKAYLSTFVLGVRTNSSDADGEIIEDKGVIELDEQLIRQSLETFSGDIEQIPSMFSAIKHQGQPLYKLAREGKEVERKVRQVTVYELRLDAIRQAAENASGRLEVDVFVRCSKGTYIRSIAEDLGQLLGCGGHVSALRRTQAGPFYEADVVSLMTLDSLKQHDVYEQMDELLRPVDSALEHLSSVNLSEAAGFYIRQGQAVLVPRAPAEGTVKLLAEDGEFLGIGEVMDDGKIAPRRLIASN
jgi:tRNA pseudouridine55 synthase